MKGDNQIITYFNCLLHDELVAVNQYFLHANLFKNWGFNRLYKLEYKECMDELDHASSYTQRILFLEGIPNILSFDKLEINKNVEDVLKSDLNLEHRSVNRLKKSIQYADSIQDYVSRDIMIRILRDEEHHISYLETELNLIVKVGIHNYMQFQMKD